MRCQMLFTCEWCVIVGYSIHSNRIHLATLQTEVGVVGEGQAMVDLTYSTLSETSPRFV